ncbi:hypothetical protein RclHR1_26690002 [Rhizophagus clarus]|uniref:Crinkler effector protein N-terminal domain-containing protein n=2 Tax=Rhizophagus clarus TaxID=94130 RepID=A0A2Z6REQ1_9GLOM|nr:hypothetical protein RclHR1_26690002 [Rhizophagus clarus]
MPEVVYVRYKSENFSQWALYLGKQDRRMSDTIITLNCLLLPSITKDRSNLSEGSITTLKISTGETVDQLRIMIRERWLHLFEKVPPASILLWKINDTEGVTSFEKQIEVYSSGKRLNETGMPSHDLISKHFSEQPPNDKIHIYIFI